MGVGAAQFHCSAMTLRSSEGSSQCQRTHVRVTPHPAAHRALSRQLLPLPLLVMVMMATHTITLQPRLDVTRIRASGMRCYFSVTQL